jgi:hypothetical protein
MKYVITFHTMTQRWSVGPFDSEDAADAYGMTWLNSDNRRAKGWWFEVQDLYAPEEES